MSESLSKKTALTAPTAEMLTLLFTIQNATNSEVRADWRTVKPEAWHRAVNREATEAQEHLGWEWWKKQEPDLKQAHIEVIDILHFGISMIMVEHSELEIEDLIRLHSWSTTNPTFENLNSLELLDVIGGIAALQRQFNVLAFCTLLSKLGLDWNDVMRLYVGKNVLFSFRRANGYREGTYIKYWHPKDKTEDNVYMHKKALEIEYDEYYGDRLWGYLADTYCLLTTQKSVLMPNDAPWLLANQ